MADWGKVGEVPITRSFGLAGAAAADRPRLAGCNAQSCATARGPGEQAIVN